MAIKNCHQCLQILLKMYQIWSVKSTLSLVLTNISKMPRGSQFSMNGFLKSKSFSRYRLLVFTMTLVVQIHNAMILSKVLRFWRVILRHLIFMLFVFSLSMAPKLANMSTVGFQRFLQMKFTCSAGKWYIYSKQCIRLAMFSMPCNLIRLYSRKILSQRTISTWIWAIVTQL